MLLRIESATYAPVLLQKKAAQRRKETGDDAYYTEFDNHDSITTILGHAFVRPFRLLFTQPIIQAIAGMPLRTRG
jgi:hypothetical protein